MRYMSILQLIHRLVHKGLFPGLSHARGKYPQPYCHSNTKPSITESPEGDPTEIPDAGLRSVHVRHRGPQQPPQGPAWPRGNYLLDVEPFLCAGRIVTTVAGLGWGSQTYIRGYTSVLRPNTYYSLYSGNSHHTSHI